MYQKGELSLVGPRDVVLPLAFYETESGRIWLTLQPSNGGNKCGDRESHVVEFASDAWPSVFLTSKSSVNAQAFETVGANMVTTTSTTSAPHDGQQNELRTYRGNCHCGAFVYEADLPEIRSALECNCSICHKKGYLWVFPEARFEIVKGTADVLARYTFGPKKLVHKVCGTEAKKSHCQTGGSMAR